MKQRINTWWKAILGGIMTLLGFSACDVVGEIISPRCEYGQPHANYKLLGDVKDTKGTPVKGIRVVFIPTGNTEERGWNNDTLYTDAKGHFEKATATYDWPGGHDKFTFVAEDVDGAANGAFQRKIMRAGDVTTSQVKKGEGSWYDGDFEVSADIILEEDTQ